MYPMVSVVIPVYNTNIIMLKKCIFSVLEQSFQNFEIIVVDDCSINNDTLLELKHLEEQFSSISIFHLKQNRGISGSRNFGIDQAKGQWICFLDHDDWWEKDYLQKLLHSCELEDTDMIVSGYKVIDESGSIVKVMPPKGQEEFIFSPWFIYSSSAPWNRLIRRDFLIKKCIRFPEGCLTEDITFNIACNCLAFNPKGVINRGYCNRVNINSVSRSSQFACITYNEMPFDDIERNYRMSVLIKDNFERQIYMAAIEEQLTALVCVFSRLSDKFTQIRAGKEAAHLIRKYAGGGYIKRAYRYNRNMYNRPAMKIIYFGYMVAIRFYLDRIYYLLVHAVLRRIM